MNNFQNFFPASTYIAGIAAVASRLATLAGVPITKTPAPYAADQMLAKQAPGSDGARSITRETANGHPGASQHCSVPIPANRINRAARRSLAKLAKGI